MAEFFDKAVHKPMLSRIPLWIHPNHLTILRGVFIIPLIIFRNHPFLAVTIVFLSSMCDLFDGPLARTRGLASQDGAMLDATSDKIFNLGAIGIACWGWIDVWLVVIIVALDVGLTCIRPIKLRFGVKTDSNSYGAVKVWIQAFGIAFVLSQWKVVEFLINPVFYTAIFFAILSLVYHARDFTKKKNR